MNMSCRSVIESSTCERRKQRWTADEKNEPPFSDPAEPTERNNGHELYVKRR